MTYDMVIVYTYVNLSKHGTIKKITVFSLSMVSHSIWGDIVIFFYVCGLVSIALIVIARCQHGVEGP